jgi:hypothetical protein
MTPYVFSIQKGVGGILTAVNMKLTDFLQNDSTNLRCVYGGVYD